VIDRGRFLLLGNLLHLPLKHGLGLRILRLLRCQNDTSRLLRSQFL
jgi:hypothetical protein